jgi:hypothetical protein
VRAGEDDEIVRWLPRGWRTPYDRGCSRSPHRRGGRRPRSCGTPIGRVVAAALALPLAEAAALVRGEDPLAELVAPLLDYAARSGWDDRVVISPFQLMAPGAAEEDPNVIALRNGHTLRPCRMANPRFDLVNVSGWSDFERAVVADCGYVEMPELRREVNGHEVRTWVVDVGPCGLVGLLFRGVAGEHGITLPDPQTRGELVLAALDDFRPRAGRRGRAPGRRPALGGML